MPRAAVNPVLWALGVCLAVGVGCGNREPASSEARLTRGREIVRAAAQTLAASKGFSVSVDETIEREGSSGAKQRLNFTTNLELLRPDRLHLRATGDVDREYWYDGRRLTVAMHRDRVFGQAAMPDTLDRALDAITERYGMPLPLTDLFYSDPERALFSESTAGGYVGVESLDGVPAIHLSFTEGPVTWEVWHAQSGQTLPLKARIVHPERAGRPVRTMTFSNWDLKRQDPDDHFNPQVPQEYEGVAILQKAAVARSK